MDCNCSYHYECLEPEYKQKICKIGDGTTNSKEQNNNNASVVVAESFRCIKCIHCVVCDRKGDPGIGVNSKWSANFKLCSKCNIKRELKMYCGTCGDFWKDSTDSTTPKVTQTQTIVKQDDEVIQTNTIAATVDL